MISTILHFCLNANSLQQTRIRVTHAVIHNQTVFIQESVRAPHDFFDRRGENIHTAHDQHIISAPFNAPQKTRMRATTGTGGLVANNHIPGPPAHQRSGFFVQMGQDKNTRFPIRNIVARFCIQDFCIDEIFGDMGSLTFWTVKANRLEFQTAIGVIAPRIPKLFNPLARRRNISSGFPTNHDAVHF